MIEQASTQNTREVQSPTYQVFTNKKSKLNESILIKHNVTKNSFSLHIYSIILLEQDYQKKQGNMIDLRKNKGKTIRNPLNAITKQKKGSLTFVRYFLKNPKKEEFIKKFKEKYPEKKNIQSKKYFPPLLLLIAHFCEYYNYPENSSEEEIQKIIQNSLIAFEEYVTENVHQTLKISGRPVYLKGFEKILNYHISRDLPKGIVKKIIEDGLLNTVAKQKDFSLLIPGRRDIRKDVSDQNPLFFKYASTEAITHILNSVDNFLPINSQRFPVVIVGEPNIRRNIILNLAKHANARLLILDPLDEYGKLANLNPQIRGLQLGDNFLLNIINTEGEIIREQVYAYWFAKILAYIANLRSDIEKTLETYLLGAYNDPNNRTKTQLQFRKFANQEITSEVTKMGRNESSIISNLLYPLGTYQEISLLTRIGRSQSLESLFETKGAVIQFAKDDEQLTKIAYLFTLLKLRSVQNSDPKILILENLDEILGHNSRYDLDLSNLILGLTEIFHLVIGVRSPSKIKDIFKQTKTKLINRLIIYEDQRLLEKEYNFSNSELAKIHKLTDKDFYLLLPELIKGVQIRIDNYPNSSGKVNIDEFEKESSKRILNSENYLRRDGIPPEIRKALFEIIKILRTKPKKMLPVEGFEQLIENCAEVNVLRAIEIAKADSFIKVIDSSPNDSQEIISLFKLTEIGEDFYRSYLALQEKIPIISLKTLTAEKDFETKIYTTLSEIKLSIQNEDYSNAIDEMITIAARLLAVLPEEERFMSGKIAAKILDHWAFLKSLQESESRHKVINHFEEYKQIVTNALKSIKHQILVTKSQSSPSKTDTPIKSERTKKRKKEHKNDQDFEYNFDFEEMDAPMNDKEKKQKRSADKKESNGSTFLAASNDLRVAGLPHLDSKGTVFSPKKKKKTMIEQYDPFDPNSEEESVIEVFFNQQKNTVQEIKHKLMLELAKHLEVKEIDDEEFIWHCLATRFNGKLDDGYSISEIVTLIKKLTNDVKEEALLSDDLINRLEKLIKSKKLIDENLKHDLKQYLADQ